MVTSRVKVLVDATELVGASRYRGIGTYIRNVLSAMQPLDVDLWGLTTEESALRGTGVRPILVRRWAPARFVERERELRLPREIARARRTYGIEVFHAPATYLPRSSQVPVVATLHDVVPLVAEGYELERPRWEKLAVRYRDAAGVVAVSDYSAAEGIRAMALDAARVSVAHLGVSGRFTPGASNEEGTYLLVVGEFDPRKRHSLAVEVLDRLVVAGADVELRIIGTIPDVYAGTWAEILARSSHASRVSVLGRVTEERLISLYRAASAVLVMSSVEGFGLPALEAMACGTPVVAFRNSATAEVVGAGAALVPEGDLEGFTNQVQLLLSDTGVRSAAAISALARAGEFTWASCGAHHVAAYQRVREA